MPAAETSPSVSLARLRESNQVRWWVISRLELSKPLASLSIPAERSHLPPMIGVAWKPQNAVGHERAFAIQA